jgi:hypothetical protein
MPAIIISSTADGERSEHWIEKRVLRIGSDADCEVVLPEGNDPHAASLQFRNGAYVLRNRSKHPVSLGGRMILPEGSETWGSQESLELPGGVSLLLSIEGDPAPAPRTDHQHLVQHYQRIREDEKQAAVVAKEAAEVQAVAEGKAPAKKSSNAQIIVGLLCLFLAGAIGVGLIAFVLAKSQSASVDGGPSPTAMVTSLLSNSAYSSQLPPTLMSRLQEAQQAIALMDREMAERRLLRLQAELVRLKDSGTSLEIKRDGSDPVDAGQYILRYINYYLSKLREG